MKQIAWLISLFMVMVGATMVVLFSEWHSWSSSATTWALAAVFAAPTVVDIAVVRIRKRSARRRGNDRAAHPAK
jgi:hypothetical protein